MDPEVRWLTDDEQRAWRALAGVLLLLPSALESQLQRDSSLSHFDYWVMALLSEEPDRTLRLSHLATLANSSLSRLSHLMSRLEERGWVERRPDPDDARASRAWLTDAGYDVVVAAAPGHVENVRRLVFDGLDRADLADLERLCRDLLHRMDAAAPPQRNETRTPSTSPD